MLLAAAAVSARWALNRNDALGRRRSFPWVSVIGLLAVGAAGVAPWLLRVGLERRLSAAASEVVGSPVTVRCQSFGQAFVDAGVELGYVRFDEDGRAEPVALIKRDQCRDLADYVASGGVRPSREAVVAVHTLTHEAVHLMGIRDEAKTECLAVQLDAEMARRLGASAESASRLAAFYWEELYPRMPSHYRSVECAAGFDLDAGLSGAPWEPDDSSK